MSDDNAGPLTKLLRGMGLDHRLPPIPKVEPIDEMPVRLNAETLLGNKPAGDEMVPVSNATPAAAICPTCRVFEIKPGSTLCPRCTRRAAIRVVENSRYRQHVEAVHRELTERRLTEIDPDWRDHYKSMEAAERAYWRELEVKTNDCGPFEPRDEI